MWGAWMGMLTSSSIKLSKIHQQENLQSNLTGERRRLITGTRSNPVIT